MKRGSTNTRVIGRELTEGDIDKVSGWTRGIGPSAQQEMQWMWIKTEKEVVSDHRTRENTSYCEGRERSLLDACRLRNSGTVCISREIRD